MVFSELKGILMVNLVIQKAIKTVGTQKELAKKVGVSQPNVWYWLHEKKKVSPQKVLALVEACGGVISPHEVRPDLPDLFPKP